MAHERITTRREIEEASADVLDEVLREKLRRHIRPLGRLTQEELARDLDFTDQSTISHVLGGRRAFGPSLAARLDQHGYLTDLDDVTFTDMVNARNRARTRGRKQPLGNERQSAIYDVFLATKMASLGKDGDYAGEARAARALVRSVKSCGYGDVYCASAEIDSDSKFDPPWMAAKANFRALGNSEFFVLYAAEPPITPSGIYVEAGYALALHKPSLYLVSGPAALPYCLRELAQHGVPELLPPVRQHIVADIDEAIAFVEHHGSAVFKELKEQARAR